MNISIFDLFNIGIGPSSSHTVGPMKASSFFIQKLIKHKILNQVSRIKINVYGSLAATGIGHGTDKSLVLGLMGYKPDTVDPSKIDDYFKKTLHTKKLFYKNSEITFNIDRDIVYKPNELLPYHPNGLLFKAINKDNKMIYNKIYYSTGGGYLVGAKAAELDKLSRAKVDLSYLYKSGKELLEICNNNNISISQLVLENEQFWRSKDDIYKNLDKIYNVMNQSINNGLNKEGKLPGVLNLPRRANSIYKKLKNEEKSKPDLLSIMDWVNLYALAVNEENASGARIVTAPTNGSAGIIPAIIKYYLEFVKGACIKGVYKILLSAGGIGLLYKTNASLSGAEVGCQGEIGVACSMAAAGLCEVLGGTPAQVENAAEIAMEHNLGLTCDPIAGLVQVPCIERNAMAAIKAINAARIALMGNGKHYVSLDKVISTMMQTGRDMQDKYKETSKGGLAINITEC